MKIFLKILNSFFVFLGIIFFIILIALSYLWVADPFNIKPLFLTEGGGINREFADGVNTDNNPLLSESQESMLRSAGINPASLPSEITPELEACAVDKIGEVRVKEIVVGATPSASEILRFKGCLEE